MTDAPAIWDDGAFLLRYWSKVDQRGIDECWPWTSAVVGRRGRIWLNGHNEVAPRIAKILSERQRPTRGGLYARQVLHSRWWRVH